MASEDVLDDSKIDTLLASLPIDSLTETDTSYSATDDEIEEIVKEIEEGMGFREQKTFIFETTEGRSLSTFIYPYSFLYKTTRVGDVFAIYKVDSVEDARKIVYLGDDDWNPETSSWPSMIQPMVLSWKSDGLTPFFYGRAHLTTFAGDIEIMLPLRSKLLMNMIMEKLNYYSMTPEWYESEIKVVYNKAFQNFKRLYDRRNNYPDVYGQRICRFLKKRTHVHIRKTIEGHLMIGWIVFASILELQFLGLNDSHIFTSFRMFY